MGAEGAEKITKIGVGSAAWASKLRKNTKSLARKIDEAQFELGVLLWRGYDTPIDGKEENNPLFMSWGYSTWKEYVETELGLQSRKAERLRLIGKVLDVDMKHLPKAARDRFVKLGWSKAREVALLPAPSRREHGRHVVGVRREQQLPLDAPHGVQEDGRDGLRRGWQLRASDDADG